MLETHRPFARLTILAFLLVLAPAAALGADSEEPASEESPAAQSEAPAADAEPAATEEPEEAEEAPQAEESPQAEKTPKAKETPKAERRPFRTPRLDGWIDVDPQRRRWVGEPITLSLRDADLVEVLRSFGKLTDANLIIDPDVQGKVTVELKNVPWDQALYVILKSNGLGMEISGNIWNLRQVERLYEGL